MDFLKWYAAFRQEVDVQVNCDHSLLVKNCKFNTLAFIFARMYKMCFVYLLVMVFICLERSHKNSFKWTVLSWRSNWDWYCHWISCIESILGIALMVSDRLSFNTESHLVMCSSMTSFVTHWSLTMECVLSSCLSIFNLEMCLTMFFNLFILWTLISQ